MPYLGNKGKKNYFVVHICTTAIYRSLSSESHFSSLLPGTDLTLFMTSVHLQLRVGNALLELVS